MKSIFKLLLVLFALQTIGCTNKSEDQQLVEFRSSVKYRAYQFTSEKTTKLAVSEYNKTSTDKISEKTVHCLLGILWFTSNKPQFACMESDAISALNKGVSDNLVLGIRTVAYHKMKWPTLSSREYEKLKSNLSLEEGKSPKEIHLEHKMTLMSLVIFGLYLREDTIATSSAKALGAVCNLDDIEPLVSLIIDARDGNVTSATQKLNELRKNPQYSTDMQVLLDGFQVILSEQKKQVKTPEEAIDRLTTILVKELIAETFNSVQLKELLNIAKKITSTDKNDNTKKANNPLKENNKM